MKDAKFDDKYLYVTWDNDVVSKYHHIWLRDSCQSEECYHKLTKQRLLNTFDIPDNICPTKLDVSSNELRIVWNFDGHMSKFTEEWLRIHSYDPVLSNGEDVESEIPRILWTQKSIVNDLPSVKFDDVMKNDLGVGEWTKKIHQYGFCLIDNVPVDTDSTQKLVERIAFIRETHYGAFWDFTSDLSKNDTAYTDLHLACHTDGTYWSDTPGLQLFHLLSHKGSGGETMLVDGFHCAEVMKNEQPELYEFLTEMPIPAHSAGDENVCIKPAIAQPIFKHGLDNELVQIRWNNDDRSIMHRWKNPEVDVPKFYRAIKTWRKILEAHEYVFQLKPGQCLIFDNWRVLHGRQKFTGARRMCGAYIGRDDYMSRFELLNYGRERVLKRL